VWGCLVAFLGGFPRTGGLGDVGDGCWVGFQGIGGRRLWMSALSGLLGGGEADWGMVLLRGGSSLLGGST